MKLDKTKYEDDKLDQQKEEEERLLIVMVKNDIFLLFCTCIDSYKTVAHVQSKMLVISGSQ